MPRPPIGFLSKGREVSTSGDWVGSNGLPSSSTSITKSDALVSRRTTISCSRVLHQGPQPGGTQERRVAQIDIQRLGLLRIIRLLLKKYGQDFFLEPVGPFAVYAARNQQFA